jgi:hypothetical protein
MTDLASALKAVNEAQVAHDKATVIASKTAQPWSQDLVILLGAGIICFSVITFLLVALLMWRSNAQPHHILRVFGILSILALSAFLMVVGYSNEQLTPIVGLFGAVAGYLLGKDAGSDRNS